MNPETCPRCGRPRTWELWRRCECGHDFGPGVATVRPSSEARQPRQPSRREICWRLTIEWMVVFGVWGVFFYVVMVNPDAGVFLGLANLFLVASRFLHVDLSRYAVESPRWFKRAMAGIGAATVILLALAFFMGVPYHPRELADAPAGHRLMAGLFFVAIAALLSLAAYHQFLVATRGRTPEQPERSSAESAS